MGRRYNFLLGQCFKNANKLPLALHYYQTALKIAKKHHFYESVLNEAHQKNIDIIKYHINALQIKKFIRTTIKHYTRLTRAIHGSPSADQTSTF